MNLRAVLISAVCLALQLTTGCQFGTPVRDDVAATVDGENIYRTDVEKYFQNQTAGSTQPLSQEQADGLRLSILDTLIENQILIHRAGKLGLLATDADIERRLKELKSPYTDQEFLERLQQRNLTLDDLKSEIRRSLTADKVVSREITSKINISEQDIDDYYNQHRAEFNLIEPRYHLAHILVSAAPDSRAHNANRARSAAEARKKIESVFSRLRAGEEFSTLAMTYSEDSATSANGGDLGIVPESGLKQTDAITRESILKLKPGEYTPVIPVTDPAAHEPAGFRIVKLISLEPAGVRELSDQKVRQDIRQQLVDRRAQLLKTAYFEVMRDQAKIENYYARELLARSGAAR
jgi:peptidyl-prolyl cis-trans isomerase SurA